MSSLRSFVVPFVVFTFAHAHSVGAMDIPGKKLLITDPAAASKRQIQIQSASNSVQYTDADDPASNGATIHVYSSTDSYCAELPAGASWSTNGKQWKFKDGSTKNSAQIGDGKLKIKLKQGVTYSLLDNGTQGIVNAQIQFGGGTRYCIRCTGNKADSGAKFQAKDCGGFACDAEPPCSPVTTTTSTTSTTATTSTSSTTTTMPSSLGGLCTYGTPTLQPNCSYCLSHGTTCNPCNVTPGTYVCMQGLGGFCGTNADCIQSTDGHCTDLAICLMAP